MTSENEKKDESENRNAKLAAAARKAYDEEIRIGEPEIARLDRECSEIDSQMPHAKGQQFYDLTLRKRVAQDEILDTYDRMIMRGFSYELANHLQTIGMRIKQLEALLGTTYQKSSLDDDVEATKKKIDEFIAKRLGQLFDKGGKGYIG